MPFRSQHLDESWLYERRREAYRGTLAPPNSEHGDGILRFLVLLVGMLIVMASESATARCLVVSVDEDRRYGPLVQTTALRAANAKDKDRAAHILAVIRATLVHYRSRDVAEAAGYLFDNHLRVGSYDEVSLPGAPLWLRPFDLHRPTALIYTPQSAVHLPVLVGALYSAVADADGSSLDDFIPTSVARWVYISRRCTLPKPHLWIIDVFPFERDVTHVWQVPTEATSIIPYSPAPMTPAAPGEPSSQPMTP